MNYSIVLFFLLFCFQQLAAQDCAKAEQLNQQAVAAFENNKFEECYPLMKKSYSLCPRLAENMLLHGNYFLHFLTLDSAKIYYRRYLWSNQNTSIANNKLAQVFFYENNYDSAHFFLNEVLQKSPKDSIALYNKAELHYLDNQWKDATLYLNTLIKYYPNHLSGNLRLCDIYSYQDKFQDCQLIVNRLKLLYPVNYDVMITESNILIHQSKWEEALSLLERCKKIDSLEATAYFLTAIVFEENNQYEKALNEYNSILKMDMFNADAYLQRAYLLMEMDQEKLALLDFLEALELDSSLSDSWFQIGIIYYNQQKYFESIDALKNFLIEHTNDADALFNLANAYLELPDLKQAITYYSRAIALRNDENFRYNRAVAYYQANEYTLALNDLNSYLRVRSEDAEAYFLRCLCNQMLERKKEACQDCNMADFLGKKDIPKNLLKACKQSRKNSN